MSYTKPVKIITLLVESVSIEWKVSIWYYKELIVSWSVKFKSSTVENGMIYELIASVIILTESVNSILLLNKKL